MELEKIALEEAEPDKPDYHKVFLKPNTIFLYTLVKSMNNTAANLRKTKTL